MVSSVPIRVGLVGTGFAAKLRAQTLQGDSRARLITVAGHSPEKTSAFSQDFGAEPEVSWRKLVEREDLDLIIICTVNRDHGTIAGAALENDKHVVVEYPLSLDLSEAQGLLALSLEKGKLLHIEHIELLGGLHQALKQALPSIGKIFSSRYVTIHPERPVPQRWTYQHSLFGFPLMGALSRLHRFTDLFGKVTRVHCQSQFWDTQPDFFRACLCHAQLEFAHGHFAESVYGKGETFWHSENSFTVYGEEGTLIFTPEKGLIIQGDTTQTVEVGARRGLFVKDTQMVLEHLTEGTPLYVNPVDSVYALEVADALARSAQLRQPISLL
jgi:biliverdin reductase